jgi:Family of unknown function (DUF5985)
VHLIPSLVYVLCFITSLVCLVMLFRSYLTTRNRMLLWSALCFVGLSINNLLLFLDVVVLPSVDLSVPRDVSAVIAVLVLLYGFITETR